MQTSRTGATFRVNGTVAAFNNVEMLRPPSAHWPRIRTLMARYQRMDLADASILVTTELRARSEVLTIDRSDFGIYRRIDRVNRADRRTSGLREVKIEPMHLNGAILFVKDFQRMRDFYRGMLQTGPVNEEWTDSYALFDLNGGRFVLHAIPDEDARDIKITSPPEARERNPVKIVFAVEDVRSERSRLAAMGVTMLERPWQNPTESCDGVDPEGNVFQIARSTR